MRKANVGDTVAFKEDSHGASSYWPHVKHQGIVISVTLKAQDHRPSRRAVYEIECECGAVLHPRGSEFNVVKHE